MTPFLSWHGFPFISYSKTKEVEMKRLLNILLVGLGIGFLSSCSSTGTMVSGTDPYRYYDNMYYYGYPSYYSAYPYYNRPIIHNRVIVVPEQNRKAVRSRTNDLRGRQAVSPNTNKRRSVQPSNREVIRNSAPSRRSTTVAPSSRQSSSPAPPTRSNPTNNSRRGNN